jgi:diguanylate cyclase (GGDEF)-like protein/PAS domain S-box-containing protein
LVVEDEPTDAELVIHQLRRSGYQLDWRRADTASEYLDGLEWDPDVILADFTLPQFSGLDALRLLGERGTNIPLIIVSGTIGEEAAASTIKSGATDYLLKDRLGRLGSAVAQALERKRLEEEARRAEEALRRSEERFRLLAEHARDIVYRYRLRPTRGFDYVSPSTTDITGYTPEEHYADPDLPHKLVAPEDRPMLEAAMRSSAAVTEPTIVQWRHRDGRQIWIEQRTVPIHDSSGNLVALEGIARDVTDRKRLEDQLAHQALHDPLTELPNRALFMDRLQHALAQSRRGRERIGVFICNLDAFKLVNDSFGHDAGDEVLRSFSDRLRSVLRTTDTVARLGGDEFAILCVDIADERDALFAVERISRALATPLGCGGREVSLAASIGIALSATPDDLPMKLLRDADTAMNGAKQRGGARSQFFDEAMRAGISERLQIEDDLRGAIEQGQFRLFYQPLVDLGAGRVFGFEALIRWQHPVRGLVSPAGFIAVAERSGLIVPIGTWALQEACRQARRLRGSASDGGSPTIAVNLSGIQFAQPNLGDVVAGALSAAGVEGGALWLEITETVLMEDAASTVGSLGALKALGVQLAIDDFGIAYSSLNYLKRFPVDMLKVDRSFVEGLGSDKESSTIVSAVVGLAHTLGMTALAEGVETAEQLAQVRALGCDAAQGYLFARPEPEDRLGALLSGGLFTSPGAGTVQNKPSSPDAG